VTGRLLSPCRRHRAALVDFVDRGEIEQRTRAALAHLDVCRTCELELERTAQAITALRRLGLEAAMAEPSPDAWPRLRARVVSQPVGGMRWGSGLGATVVGMALVAAIGLPIALRQATGLSVSPSSGLGLFGAPAGAGEQIRRIYDPPAQPLTGYIISLLSGQHGISQAQPAQLMTVLPAATDRAQAELPSRAPVVGEVDSPPHRVVRS
jgi:hypothetical protein